MVGNIKQTGFFIKLFFLLIGITFVTTSVSPKYNDILLPTTNAILLPTACVGTAFVMYNTYQEYAAKSQACHKPKTITDFLHFFKNKIIKAHTDPLLTKTLASRLAIWGTELAYGLCAYNAYNAYDDKITNDRNTKNPDIYNSKKIQSMLPNKHPGNKPSQQSVFTKINTNKIIITTPEKRCCFCFEKFIDEQYAIYFGCEEDHLLHPECILTHLKHDNNGYADAPTHCPHNCKIKDKLCIIQIRFNTEKNKEHPLVIPEDGRLTDPQDENGVLIRSCLRCSKYFENGQNVSWVDNHPLCSTNHIVCTTCMEAYYEYYKSSCYPHTGQQCPFGCIDPNCPPTKTPTKNKDGITFSFARNEFPPFKTATIYFSDNNPIPENAILRLPILKKQEALTNYYANQSYHLPKNCSKCYNRASKPNKEHDHLYFWISAPCGCEDEFICEECISKKNPSITENHCTLCGTAYTQASISQTSVHASKTKN